MSRISVIIPCYKQGAFLRQSVGSVLAQTARDVEVIVIDDGSPDDTGDVARSFGERVRYLRIPNSGPSAARNAGIEIATGEFLAFLDADDIFEPEALQARLDALDADPDACVCLGEWCEVDSTGSQVLKAHPAPDLRQDPFHTLLRANISPPLCYLVRRKAVIDLGMFRTDERGTEDWDLWLRIAAAGHRFIVGAPGAKRKALYRVHGDSLSRNFRLMHLSAMRTLKAHERDHPDCPTCRACVATNRSELRRLYAMTLLHRFVAAGPVHRSIGIRCRSLLDLAADVVAEPPLLGAVARIGFERLRERLSIRRRSHSSANS